MSLPGHTPKQEMRDGSPCSLTSSWGSLETWLRGHVEGYRGPAVVTRFQGGQSNPTYRLDAPSGSYVLRKKPSGPLLPSAHAIHREHRVMAAVAGRGVPVPRMFGYCGDEGIIGTAFYVMEFVPGRIFFDQTLPGVTAADRTAIYDSMNAVIAALHSIDPEEAGLKDFGRPGSFLARQIALWTRQYEASITEDIPAMTGLIEWLPARLPQQARTSVVHGDFRLDNIVIDPIKPRVVAVLDWELSTTGDPLADFAYHAMAWRISPAVFRGLGGIDVAGLGIPGEADYVAAYCRRTGHSQGIPDWEYYMVFSMFRIAAIIQGIARRAVEGNAASSEAERVGAAARPIAEQAWTLAQKIDRGWRS